MTDTLTVSEILELGREHADLHGLLAKGWSVVDDDRAKRRGGQCRYREREIGLSATHLLSQWPYDEVLDVVLHEIAHAKVGPGHGHGAKWKAMAEQVGADPTRCYRRGLPEADARWIGTCSAGHERTRLRCPSDVLFCRKDDCPGAGMSGDMTGVIDWEHVESGKRPTGKGYAESFRLYWDEFCDAYRDGTLEPMFGAPHDPLHMVGETEGLDDHYFLIDLERGRHRPLLDTPEEIERMRRAEIYGEPELDILNVRRAA